MLETENLPLLSLKEAEKKRKLFQKKKTRMASSWFNWIQFEKPLREQQPEYFKALHDIVVRISQEINHAKISEDILIRWDEARNRVLNFDRIESLANRFGKSHATIHGDVGKIASHSSWMSHINRCGDYWILNEVIKETSGNIDSIKSIIVTSVKPIVLMTAIEIKREATKQNEAFTKIQKEFLGDEPPKARTTMFSFVSEMDLMVAVCPKKKSRKNWRKEIGI